MSKQYIDKLFNRDRLALQSISKCGHVSHDQLKTFVADTRIRNYARDGLVQKVAFKMNNGKNGECYKLSKEGKELVEKQWGIKDHYHAQSPAHDLGLANKYFSLTEGQRDTWQTETQLRDQFTEKLQELRDQGEAENAEMYLNMLSQGYISMPDASFSSEQGIEISFEVVTNNYGDTELQAKEAYVQIMNTQYETTRV